MANESNDDLESWLAEPFTHATSDRINRVLLPACLAQLLHAARGSTDPKVTAAYQGYVAAITMQALFSKGEIPK